MQTKHPAGAKVTRPRRSRKSKTLRNPWAIQLVPQGPRPRDSRCVALRCSASPEIASAKQLQPEISERAQLLTVGSEGVRPPITTPRCRPLPWVRLPGSVRRAITRHERWIPRSRGGHSIRVFSSGIGGEAALTRGFPLEMFPESMRQLIVQAFTPLSVANFCQQIAQEQHLDPQVAALAGLTAQQKLVIASTDRIRNVSPRQQVYGAIRFLEGPDATFQIVCAGPASRLDVLSQMAALVKSWSRL